ncbi:Zn-dependent alcohol dehydrogenase class III-like protein [Paraburkholderia atlantica]|uniref:Zn-dependent alcohol dehydrogenase class III-like protein n=1 Tax=Paraburkholderia atlantica TaxID=2654982 RepID=D5WCF9_PARAM|nr:Zn-dependent alcohol dehydrogenase class III-like protein [Paraburkholderia atlantica]
MMKSKGAVAWKAGAPLTIEEVDLEGPRAGEVLSEVKATGICHTDDYITHRLPLECINEGFDLMKKAESIRSVVLY